MTGNRVSREQAMRHLHTVTLAMLMGFTGLVLATEPPAAAHSYCGSAANWVEFDSQMAKLDKDFSSMSIDSNPVLPPSDP
jgi:hypothetical protein